MAVLPTPAPARALPPPGPTIGVDVGGTKVLGLRLAPDGTVEASRKRPTPSLAGDLVLEVAGELGIKEGPEAAPLGVGCPGMVDLQGKAHFCPHLHDLDGFPLGRELAARRPSGATTVVFNDATAACWAEHSMGAAQDAANLLMVTMGTGIGGGLVLGGRLVEGAHGFAGEIGHMVIDPAGPPCPCGKRGCWERYASGSGLGWLARQAVEAGRLSSVVQLAGRVPDAVRGEHVSEAARAGDPEAVEVVRQLARWLALGLANLANLLDPSVIVLGGGVIEAGDVVLEPVREEFAAAVEGPGARGVHIRAAYFGERAGAMGAALLARRVASTGR
jgi:glucokinase